MEALYLFIHTLLDKQLMVGLFNKKRLIDRIIQNAPQGHSKTLLNLIDNLLKKNQLKLDNLRGILVVNGPGSFTSIRIGLAVANTLAYLLKIPAVGIKINEFNLTEKNINNLIKIGRQKLSKIKKWQLVSPFYGKKPNITIAKKWQ